MALVALDPASFPDIPRRWAMGTRGRGLAWELVPAGGRAVALAGSAAIRRPFGALARELAGCAALVAVGGGYLRAVGLTSSIGTALNHLGLTSAEVDRITASVLQIGNAASGSKRRRRGRA